MPRQVSRIKLIHNTPKQNGRPKNLQMPPLPQEIYDSLSDLEKEYFDFFIAAMKKELPNITPKEYFCVFLGAIEFINTIRLEFEQLKTGQLVMQSRQNPNIQLRAWMQEALQRNKAKKIEKEENDERAKLKDALLGLSAVSGDD